MTEVALPIHLDPDDVARFTAAAEARPDSLMDSATDAFAIMAAAAAQGARDAAAAAAVVVGDTCLQICVSPAATWRAAESKVRFLGIMIPWAWPRYPALGAVLDASRRAESEAWGDPANG